VATTWTAVSCKESITRSSSWKLVSHYYYANLLAALGRFDSAVVEAQGALDLDPMSPNARQNLTFILYLARRYDQALAYARKTLESEPAFGGVYYDLGLIYQRLRKYDEALAAFGQVGATAKRGNTVLAAVGATHALAGRQTEGRAALAHLEGASATEYVSTYDLALLNVALGDGDGALTLLNRACDEHSAFMPFLNVDARLDTLRADPRFTTLVRRLGVVLAVGWLNDCTFLAERTIDGLVTEAGTPATLPRYGRAAAQVRSLRRRVQCRSRNG
jgi:tetratricopeptide (TPR) repeat protein